MRNENGISLIALVITIIVMIILAGTVIFYGGLTITDRAEEARLRANVSMVQTGIVVYRAEHMLNPANGASYDANYSLATDTNWADALTSIETVKNDSDVMQSENLRKVNLAKLSVSTDNQFHYYANNNGEVVLVKTASNAKTVYYNGSYIK